MSKKVAIYPGSFNPYHEGHREVIDKGLILFDKIIVAIGYNPDKPPADLTKIKTNLTAHLSYAIDRGSVEVVTFGCLLADYVYRENKKKYNINAVLRGLRNGNDFEYEKTQQRWNDQLGLGVPTIYVISSARNEHISSSAIRAVESFRKTK